MFDPYHKWLGIPPEHRPPTHYQLLHLSPTEKDLEVIEEAAIRQTTHLRSYQLGPHSDLCTRLLNEVAVARKTLLMPALREKYDAELARKSGPTKPAPVATFDVVDKNGEGMRAGTPRVKATRSRDAAEPRNIARPAPSKLPLWIGVGVGGVLVLVIVTVIAAALVSHSSDPIEPKKKKIVIAGGDRKKEVVNPIPIPIPIKNDVPEKKLPVNVNGQARNPAKGRIVDLVALFDPAEVVKGQGKWNVVDGRLECTDMHLLPRTHFPYKPPAEYDYTVKFSQARPRNGISMILPNGLGRSFYWNVARMQPDGVWWTLATSIDGMKNLYSRFDTFRVGEPCTATIEVRKSGVRCFIDGKFVGEHNDFATMNNDVWRQMKNPDVLSLACDDPTTFYEVKVIEVGEQGVIVRDPAK